MALRLAWQGRCKALGAASCPPATFLQPPPRPVAAAAPGPTTDACAVAASVGGEDGRRPEWLEVRGGFAYCVLCHKQATDMHLASERHQRRAWDHEVSIESHDQGPLPDWMEMKEGYRFCTLCKVFATDGHLNSAKHQTRLESWLEWADTEEVSVDPAEGPPSAWGDPSHFVFKQGWWWCKLCDTWSDLAHAQGKRHKRHMEFPDWYNDEEGLSALLAIAEETSGKQRREVDPDAPWGPAFQAAVMGGTCGGSSGSSRKVSGGAAEGARKAAPELEPQALWRKAYSLEYDRIYYINALTGHCQWDNPGDAILTADTFESGSSDATRFPCSDSVSSAAQSSETLPRDAQGSSGHLPCILGPHSQYGPDGWREKWAEEHNCFYYWHEADPEGSATWDRPACLAAKDDFQSPKGGDRKEFPWLARDVAAQL